MTPCHKDTREMAYIDIHTHNTAKKEVTAVYNGTIPLPTDRKISVGLHPWDIDSEWREKFEAIAVAAKAGNVAMIGECGIDYVKAGTPAELQEEIFKEHIKLSESVHKPLIIHCVKAFDRIITLHKEHKPTQAWIIHGFRGKPQLAASLTREGLYLSLGEHFNSESARAIPCNRLFVESDESAKSIEEIYTAIAQERGCTTEELAEQTKENARHCGIEF